MTPPHKRMMRSAIRMMQTNERKRRTAKEMSQTAVRMLQPPDQTAQFSGLMSRSSGQRAYSWGATSSTAARRSWFRSGMCPTPVQRAQRLQGRPAARLLPLPQPEPLELPGLRPRQAGDELDLAGVLVGRDLGLDVLLQLAGCLPARLGSRIQDHEGLDDLPPLGVRQPDHATFLDIGVLQQDALDLRRGDLVPGGDDEVVGPRLIPEVAVLVGAVGVAGQIPAVLHVSLLALGIVEVAAAGRTAHGEAADLSEGHLLALLVHDLYSIAGHGLAGGARPDVALGGAQEGVEHLGRADAVEDRETGRPAPGLPGRDRQGLAGRDALAQARQVMAPGEPAQGAIDGRHGEADRRPVVRNPLQEARG